ncbi:flagellar biosynthesis protein FlgE [Oleiphilus sp. HI0071]|nr:MULTISPECIES: flagellar hook protein FlgE [unclassified Oleiphilus]KZY63135.1 flagellar biosynthesis protein FlgE [Oleiphilus sp. HI0065]KZY79643.1 flagellar biosynthesis protein FlgE [Oleiphilus sp. HI0071]KZZ06140.1 flagellar biosynthesis protein FlgE [Oleiphilus sp. HI0073]KZZ40142.1 flagellar biosynthesis protein FlgE [Oleiphilus sp. HI0118]KZZ51952.1 flagellar biosynthesis protein FlgE [Oleiphilus sp. HI0122]KZZ69661.1 flagellar biosynthesis protein FlgE [Oleiphilus sp. HI0130]KZZ782
MAFNVALSGLKVSATDLEVTGNNIANASTVGFKRSRAEFGDAYSNSFFGGGIADVGDGVQVQAIRQIHSQGNVEFTDNGLDMAITGNGYFILSDNGEAKYSRAGQFGVNREGYLVNNTGMRVQGFQADDEGNVSGVLGDLTVETNDLAPRQTTDVAALLNLSSSESVLADSGSTLESDGTDVGVAQAGPTNGYSAQSVTVTYDDGNPATPTTTESVTTQVDESARAIADRFSALSGVNASARTSVNITEASWNNASQTMTISVNGVVFQPTDPTLTAGEQLADIGQQINSSALVGTTAVLNGNDLEIIQDQGEDLRFAIAGTAPDAFDVQGSAGAAQSLAVGGGTTATVGGVVEFILDDNYAFSSGTGEIVGSTVGQPFVNNAFDPVDAGTYNHATSTKIYDSLGNSHVLELYFVKQPQPSNVAQEQSTWQMHVLIDDTDVGDPLIGTDPSRATFNVVFNGDGTLNETLTDDVLISNWIPLDEEGNPNGATLPLNVVDGGVLPIDFPPTSSNFEIDISELTQFGSPFAVNDLSQNGYTTGRLVGLDVEGDGVILSRFSNGEAQVLGQVALANFRDKEGLAPIGESVWIETFTSGDAVVGAPGTASLGVLTASATESSNVDLSQELVALIVAQRNYQANSKTIETSDTIQQTILNI